MGCLKLVYHSATEELLFPSALRVVHSRYRACPDLSGENNAFTEVLANLKITLVFLRVEPEKNDQNIGVNGYVLNNPLSHVDPSGEFIPLLGLVFIAGMSNVAFNLDNINNFGQGLAYFGIGAAAAVAGAGIGAGVSSFLGGSSFITGAITGASGGFAGGFTGGFGNALLGGASFGSAFSSGLKGGAIGALGGGLLGGIFGGINAMSDGRNFWTGEGTSEMTLGTQLVGGEKPEFSTKYAKEFSFRNQELNKLSANVDNLYADGTSPSGYTSKDGFLFSSKGQAVNGVTTYKGIFNKTIDVFLSKSAFISKPQLYMTMHHEYMHAYFFNHGIPVVDGGHNIIHNWHFDQLKSWGPAYVHRMYQNPSWYSPIKTYSQFGFKVINSFPW